jgi:uncharacterized PurR-regulated membrane protein YhhQ (DUF165 family)
VNRPRTAAALAAAFVLTAAAANWLTGGPPPRMAPVGFGLECTLGTFAAGLALALRDGLQDACGPRRARWVVLAAILAGAALSFVTSSPELAIASGAAFLVSELLDAVVYTPLRGRARLGGRRWAGAVTASNAAGALVDTLVFLALVPFLAITWPVVAGQMLGKAYATFAYLAAGRAAGRAVVREPLVAEGV